MIDLHLTMKDGSKRTACTVLVVKSQDRPPAGTSSDGQASLHGRELAFFEGMGTTGILIQQFCVYKG